MVLYLDGNDTLKDIAIYYEIMRDQTLSYEKDIAMIRKIGDKIEWLDDNMTVDASNELKSISINIYVDILHIKCKHAFAAAAHDFFNNSVIVDSIVI